jgi:hypothetical protein
MRRSIGYVKEKRKGVWSIKMSLGKDSSGKYRYQWMTVRGNRIDAENKVVEFQNQLKSGSYFQPGKTTVGQYLEMWLADYVKPSLSPRSYERYMDIVNRLLVPRLGKIRLTQLKPGQLQRLYTEWLESGLSARTVKYHMPLFTKRWKLL